MLAFLQCQKKTEELRIRLENNWKTILLNRKPLKKQENEKNIDFFQKMCPVGRKVPTKRRS